MIYVVGLLIAFVLVALFSTPATRACRWREYRQDDTARWQCIQCGAEVMGKPGEKPSTCLKSPG